MMMQRLLFAGCLAAAVAPVAPFAAPRCALAAWGRTMLPASEHKFCFPVGAAVIVHGRTRLRSGPADAPEQNHKFTRPAVQFTRLLQRWRRAWSTRGVTAGGKAEKGENIEEVSAALGCEPPLSVPKWVWKWAWEVFKAAMPLLHLFDRLRPSDTCVNLSVAWWKAIAGNRRGAITSDGGLAWDLLPPVTRHIVGYPLCLLFPRLHHQNVALRTAFLDAACQSEVRRAHAQGQRVRLVALGAGFDTRSLKFASNATPPDFPITTPPHFPIASSSTTPVSDGAAGGGDRNAKGMGDMFL